MKFGQVQSLWRYPVKSLQGESLRELDFDGRGVVGDRAFAVANAQGKFGSGKDTTRFRRIDGLADLGARGVPERVSITFPDGSAHAIGSEEVDAALTEALGQEVRLVPEADVSHFDDGAVHLLTTHALNTLRELLPDGDVDARRFRGNIVIETNQGIPDEDLVGRTLGIGDVLLEVTHRTERCRMISMAQPGLARAPAILKSVASEFGMNVGVYARVRKTGRIRLGDGVQLSKPVS